MDSEARTAVRDELDPFDRRNQRSGATSVEMDLARRTRYAPSWMPGIDLTSLSQTDSQSAPEMNPMARQDQDDQLSRRSTNLGELIERRFIPEYVAIKRSAGRSDFRGILNHVLPPEQVAGAFAANPEKMNYELKAVPGWPYIHSLQLCEIKPETMRHLPASALKNEYPGRNAYSQRHPVDFLACNSGWVSHRRQSRELCNSARNDSQDRART
jgi:hypothetical protein